MAQGDVGLRHSAHRRASRRGGGPYRARPCLLGAAPCSSQNADLATSGRRRAGMVQSAGRQLSDLDERVVRAFKEAVG